MDPSVLITIWSGDAHLLVLWRIKPASNCSKSAVLTIPFMLWGIGLLLQYIGLWSGSINRILNSIYLLRSMSICQCWRGFASVDLDHRKEHKTKPNFYLNPHPIIRDFRIIFWFFFLTYKLYVKLGNDVQLFRDFINNVQFLRQFRKWSTRPWKKSSTNLSII